MFAFVDFNGTCMQYVFTILVIFRRKDNNFEVNKLDLNPCKI